MQSCVALFGRKQPRARLGREAARRGDILGCKQDGGYSYLSTVRFATGPKISMGHVLGAEKGNFLIRGRGRPTVYGGRAGLILSIPVKQVSLGSPRVGTIHVQAPTPHAPALQAFLADFSQPDIGPEHKSPEFSIRALGEHEESAQAL